MTGVGGAEGGGGGGTAWVTGGAGFNAFATWAKFQRRAKELRTISANGAGIRLICASVAESPFLWVNAWKSVAPMPATSSAWPAVESLQAIAAQLYRLLGRQHAGRFHVAVRHALLVNGSERPHHGFGYFATLFRGEGLTLQHIRETLLDVLHDGIHKQGVVEVDLANFEDGDQIRVIHVLRGLKAGNDLIRIRQGLGEAEGGGGAFRVTCLALEPRPSAFGSHQADVTGGVRRLFFLPTHSRTA